MKGDVSERGAFVPYPTNRVVGTIQNAAGTHAAIQALLQAGFDRDDIDVLHGESDLERLDPTGESHGFLAQFQRALVRTAAVEEYEHLKHHVEDVRAGRFVVMVRTNTVERRHLAADILSSHGGTSIGFYGRWAWESLEASERAPDPAPGRTYESRIDGAHVRVHYHSSTAATVTTGVDDADATTRPATVTPVRLGISMLSWRDANNLMTVQVHDHENGAAYAVVPHETDGPRHIDGTLRRID